MIRVTGGKYRSRRLSVADDIHLRPTTDFNRQVIFNWLGPAIEGAVVLDLFSGSGALGIEALSRGANTACFVEISRKHCDTITNNLTALAIDQSATEVICMDATLFCNQPHHDSDSPRHSIIFADPPYSSINSGYTAIQSLHAHGRIATGAYILLEGGRQKHQDKPLPILPDATLLKHKTSSRTTLALWQVG